ncbi:hypothetical protein [Pseudovibrio exalbescens]|uniref:hypothetical protein n=1 Tax=Pseudovibrio exalbescens TaxID=197461 RepID=UPI0011AF1FAB|nr:hypothetical protein [Pseudovibrio exalbescens]
MKTTREMAEVMLAFDRGEPIDCKPSFWIADADWQPVVVSDGDQPLWDWSTCDYRVAHRPHEVNWDEVGPAVNHFATDADGAVFGYRKLPRLFDDTWGSGGGTLSHPSGFFPSFKPGNIPFRESLISRPGHEDGDKE